VTGGGPARRPRVSETHPAGAAQLVDWPARVGLFDDLSLGIVALLDDQVPIMTLDDLLRFEDLVAVDDREPAWIFADGLVFGAGELNEPVAAQWAALAHEGQQTR
jgi:hypothetical protein